MILVITVVFFLKSTYRFEHKSMSECTLRAELPNSFKEEKERLCRNRVISLKSPQSRFLD